MKKIISLLVLFVFILVGCGNEKYKSVKSVEDFDELIGEAGVLKYDIRSEEECEKGHIPSFICMDSLKTAEKFAEDIMLVYPNQSKKIIIISSDDKVLEIYDILASSGYHNLYYFEGGYERYASEKIDFIPEEGCNCE